jgi:CheY-like chemotaxis protein
MLATRSGLEESARSQPLNCQITLTLISAAPSATPVLLACNLYRQSRVFVRMSSRKRPTDVTRRAALIVEDHPQLQKAMSSQLARMGFHVLSASHYDAAVAHLATRELHVVCVDVGLPSRSGYELCEHIRGSLGLGLPILMMSEYGSPEDMAYAENAGANAYLRKPFSMRQLTHCVESLLNATHRSAPPMRELQPRASRPISAAHVANRCAESTGISASASLAMAE